MGTRTCPGNVGNLPNFWLIGFPLNKNRGNIVKVHLYFSRELENTKNVPRYSKAHFTPFALLGVELLIHGKRLFERQLYVTI